MAPLKLLTIDDHPVMSVKTIGAYRERLKTQPGIDNARALDRFAAGCVAADPARRTSLVP